MHKVKMGCFLTERSAGLLSAEQKYAGLLSAEHK